jgi:hypothetical protein
MQKRCLVVFVSIVLLSCGKNGSTPTPNPTPGGGGTTVDPVSISTDVSSFALVKNGTKKINATVNPVNVTNSLLTWTSNNTAVATVDQTGLVKAIAPGNAIITVVSQVKPTVTATVGVKVLISYDVYMVGNGPGYQWTRQGLYWKNGILQTIPTGSFTNCSAYSIQFVGNDEYIGGSLINQYGDEVACYWKNGSPFALTPTNLQYDYFTKNVIINGSEVIVPTYYYQRIGCCTDEYKAYYYRVNGSASVQYPLNLLNSNTVAFDGVFSGGNVYVAGAIERSTHARKAMYWKNTVADSVSLTDGQRTAEGRLIATSGSDIYVAGILSCANSTCAHQIMLWKNNANNVTTVSTAPFSAYPEAMVIKNNVIYIVGYEITTTSKYTAKLWKIENGNVLAITLSPDSPQSAAYGLTVSGEDIFVCGVQGPTINSDQKATYWRIYNNEVVETVSYYNVTSVFEIRATGIAVK